MHTTSICTSLRYLTLHGKRYNVCFDTCHYQFKLQGMQTCTVIFSYTTVTKLPLIAVTISHLQTVWKSVADPHFPVPCSSDSKHEKYPHTHVRMVAGSRVHFSIKVCLLASFQLFDF